MPETRDPPLRVLVVSDDALTRSGLAALLAGGPGLAVVGPMGTAEALADIGEAREADVAVWDLGLGSGRGSARLRELLEAHPGLPVVAILSSGGQAAEALATGARAVLLRDADAARLLSALRAAAEGLMVLDVGLAESLLRPPPGPASPPVESLTPRELEVLQLLAQGLSNKLIAQRLGISEHTAKFHVNAILGKLGVQSRTEAVVQAARLGLVIL